MNELNWINTARQYIGLQEVKGTKHNPAIIQMLDVPRQESFPQYYSLPKKKKKKKTL